MSFIQATTRAGKTIILEQYYAPRHNLKGIERRPNTEDTSEAQEKANAKKAIRELTIILNANFGEGDHHLVLDYKPETRPETPDEAVNDRNIFLRRLRRAYKKAGIPLKYVITTEHGTQNKALHHHLIINNESASVPPEAIQKLWNKGRVHFNLLDNTGQYSQLAAYLLKNRKYWKECGGGRQWTRSRNLIRPKTYKTIIRMDIYYNRPKPRKGMYISPGTETEGFTKDGFPYRSCIFVEAGNSP